MKIIKLLLFLSIVAFCNDTYYRKATENERGIIVATYVSQNNDTILTANIPGTMIPFRIEVKDGVVVSNDNITIIPVMQSDSTKNGD